jgi:LAS superfamily LD-carboxypeptidase LdcB
MLDIYALTGRSSDHVVQIPGAENYLQPAVIDAFIAMRDSAAKEGFDLVAVSAFRDFSRQRKIWNAKYRLEKPLRDHSGQIIDGARLDERARLEAMMRWSAMPGASRHHWGTDCDVYDRAAINSRALQLTPEEYAPGGPCFRLHEWLKTNMHYYGFYQPYRSDRGGVCPEPWHLSHKIAGACEQQLSAELLCELLRDTALHEDQRIEGQQLLLENMSEWYRRFVATVDPPPF